MTQPYPHNLTPVAEVGDPQNTGIEISTALPDRFAETARHVNCPDVPIVMLLRDDGRKRRPMAFRGIVVKASPPLKGCALRHISLGDIAVSMPREFGYAGHMHFIPAGQVIPM